MQGERPSVREFSPRLRAYGSRCNAFGALHNNDPSHRMEVPHSWITREANFSRSYHIQAQGIMDAPLVWARPAMDIK
jgi:hypothetical protein